MTDAWQTVLSAAENDDPVIVAERTKDWPEGIRDEFIAAGLLEASTMLDVLACPECPEAMLRDVRWIEHPVTGEAKPYRICPCCGPEEVSPDILKCWTVAWPVLAEAVGAALGTRGNPREIVPQRLWRLGKIPGGGEVYFGRAMHRRDAAPFLQPIAPVEDGWLIVPRRVPDAQMAIAVTSLDAISVWENGALSINEVVQPAAGTNDKPKRRRRKRADRAGLIDRLTREMERHVRAARDHARAALDFRGEAVLLPRPTQRDLAARCNATEVAVSRCLRDPTARELRMLWDLAGDLDRLVSV